jgi:hypothetical protein
VADLFLAAMNDAPTPERGQKVEHAWEYHLLAQPISSAAEHASSVQSALQNLGLALSFRHATEAYSFFL